jgi:hypothetical protein
MNFFLLIFFCPLFVLSQYQPNDKLPFKTSIITDSTVVTGYYIYDSDSAIILSPKKRYSAGNTISVRVNAIKEVQIKNRKGRWGGAAALSVVGFVIAAGLSHHSDMDNDGKTSFFELIFTAIEGTTSHNRQRRQTALIAGASGGFAGFMIGLLSNKKFSLVFPVQNRRNFYSEKKWSVRKYVDF